MHYHIIMIANDGIEGDQFKNAVTVEVFIENISRERVSIEAIEAAKSLCQRTFYTIRNIIEHKECE